MLHLEVQRNAEPALNTGTMHFAALVKAVKSAASFGDRVRPFRTFPPCFPLGAESNAQDLWIAVGEEREGRTFPNDPVMVIE